jgi:hypothetical protein
MQLSIMRTVFAALIVLVVLVAAVACGLPTGTDNDTSDGGQVCSVAADCPNIACICDDGSAIGTPVNSRRCVDDRCQSASDSCPASCSAFGFSWTGRVVDTGGGGGGGGGGGAPGARCGVAADCQAHTCSCPDGSFLEDVRDCFDGTCFGANECESQCCELGHC